MPKLLYISNLRLPTEKAYGIQIAKMCEAFALQNMEVTLAYPLRINNIKGSIFSYYSVRQNFETKKILAPDFYFWGRLDKVSVMFKDFISGITLAFYALTREADIIYSRDEWPLYFLSFFRKNLVYEAHRFSGRRAFFYRRFRNKNIKIVAITAQLKDDLARAGLRSENILVSSDGVDLDEFNIGISKEEARAKTGLPLDKKIVMYTGHLFEWKGVITLLDAVRLIADYNSPAGGQVIKNILFVFVGGMERDVKKFKERAGDLENIIILGHRPHKEIPVFLKSADALVLPNSANDKISNYTSPLKLFEYMSSGRPIIASKLPAITEVLNNFNSVLVGSDDSHELAEGMIKVLEDEKNSNGLAARALEDVGQYTWQERAGKIVNFIS